MKKLIFFTIIIGLYATTSQSDCVRQMGGVKRVEQRGNNTLILCGSCDSLLCKKYCDGELIIGDWCTLWYPTDPNDETIGVGYIDALFQGYPEPENPASGIIIEITPQTEITSNYLYWETQCNSCKPIR